jgi:predicted Abi (CAAX) family protease
MLLKFFGTLIDRFMLATRTVPTCRDWVIAIALLLGYGLIYLPIGFGSGFLKLSVQMNWGMIVMVLLRALLTPALFEELVFRVLLIPHKTEILSTPIRWWLTVFSWIAFIVYHPLNPLGEAFFSEPIFLTGAGLLGTICTVSYLQCGSYWLPVFMHWLLVVIWLLVLGGLEKFSP